MAAAEALPHPSLPGPWAWACILPGVRALDLCRLGGLLQERLSIVSSPRTHVMGTVHAWSHVRRDKIGVQKCPSLV